MDEQLKYTFSNVNDCLKFAETKCAALLAGSAAVSVGIGQKLAEGQIEGVTLLYAWFVLTQLLFCLLFCLISFVPSLNMPWLFKLSAPGKDDNLLFFEHIAKYSVSGYLLAINSNIKKEKETKFQRDIAQQIVVNSVITRRKFSLFNVAVWFFVSALITPIFAFLLWLVKK